MARASASCAPRPRGNCLSGFRRDHPREAPRLQREGADVVRMRIGPFLVHQLSRPDLIGHVLPDKPCPFGDAFGEP
jgi:hypothetical protein